MNMIEPSKIEAFSQKYSDQNMKFRAFLKNHADSDELDAQFLELHNELFADYDCCKCSNCCKTYVVSMDKNDISAISKFIGIPEDDFIEKYLDETGEGYVTKDKPCCFLDNDGKCRIQECKPTECRDFPYTDKTERLFSMFGVMEFAEICPVVFEIVERLKKIYRTFSAYCLYIPPDFVKIYILKSPFHAGYFRIRRTELFLWILRKNSIWFFYIFLPLRQPVYKPVRLHNRDFRAVFFTVTGGVINVAEPPAVVFHRIN